MTAPRRAQPLYHPRVARGTVGRRRHLFRGTGQGITSCCGDAMFTVALTDEETAPRCMECRLVAITEIALALDTLGLITEAVAVAGAVSAASYETRGAMTG